MNPRISLSISTQKPAENLTEVALTLYINWGRMPQGIRTGPPDLQQDRGQGWGWGRVRWSRISGFPYPRLVLTLLGGGGEIRTAETAQSKPEAKERIVSHSG